MAPIAPISTISSVLRSGPVHLLLEATVGKELLLQPFDVAFQEDIFLMDERTIVSRVEVIAAEDACLSASWVIEAPLLKVAHTEVVLVIEE